MSKKSQRSLIPVFFKETKYKEGSGSERIVSEIDELFKKGEHSITIDSLISIVKRRHPVLKKTLVSVEGRVRKVVSWAKSKGLIETEGDIVRIIPE
jgi:hypothetical protein